ncbi:MAG: peptidylprolyl isomerase [Phycisphaerales bacterium]|nr:peptidylprolyl isomerase [Phycisphaerales bacterium]
MEDDQPTGSAIVVQPLRSRPPVRTTRDTRSDGKTPFTRIIGWGPTLLRPDNADDVKLSESWLEGDALITSGYRLYPETDALLETDRGNMTIAFCHSEAPNTVANFTRLAQEGFYDGTTFHRIVGLGRDGFPFVIQGGDPTGTGEGGPGWDLPIEPSSLPHDFGVISMARADEPDSAGSQFFLCLSREGTARLDGQYCAFGYLTAGAETMLGISQVQVADIATGRPSIATSIPKVRMIPSSSHVALEDRRGRRLTAPATTTSPPAVPR